MTDEVKKVTIQVRPPRGQFAGEVAIGYYVVFENQVILTDADGKPVGDKRHLETGADARLIACRMVRERRRSSGPTGFHDKIIYPKVVF